MKITKILSKTQWQNIDQKNGRTKQAQNTEEINPDQNIAKTILQQLGSNKFIAMTGARGLMNIGNGLSFKLPSKSGFTKNGINYVKIILNSMDTYDMEFGRIRGHTYTIIQSFNNIYADQLQTIFTETTGLDTHL